MHKQSGQFRSMLLAAAVALWACPTLAEPLNEGVELFEKSIRPVLVAHCYQCHSSEAAAQGKLEAGLSLDSKQGLLAGGESGPTIVPGDADNSLLISALKYESYEMPPQGRLPAKVIDDFVKWINLGAPDPRDATAAPAPRRTAFQITAEDRLHWSFRPVGNPPPPAVNDAAWARDDLDRFVLAPLEREGRRASQEADRHALLRRTTYALTGLPPTPEVIAAFVDDDSPDAFTRVVDRLLASSEFGVHWGRRWLDGVRYADNIDTSGEYRRWVIKAFNEDLPYDQFVKLQIAGDLIPADASVPAERIHSSGASLDGIAATGMLALAVWEQVGLDLAVAEIVDSQIDVVGRQLLGLTLACARCHDHKFDPISAQDYYAMAGVFFSSHIATGKIIADGRLGREFVEVPLLNAAEEAANRQLDEEAAQLQMQIAAIVKKVPQAARLAELNAKLDGLEGELKKATAAAKKKLSEEAAKWKEQRDKLVADAEKDGWEKSPPELDEIASLGERIAALQKKKFKPAMAVAVAEGGVPGGKREKIGDTPIYLRGEFQREGAIVPRRFPTILAGDEQTPISEQTDQSGRLELAQWIASADNPLTARVMVNRIWQQMIGHGLVRTPDNFGRLAEPPTHPELLDHLAQRFIASGWSVKHLVRDIALSATFRQTSLVPPEASSGDPENLAVAHMNRRRLTYEELRDTLLVLGGRFAADGSEGEASPKPRGASRRTMFEPLDRRKTDVTAAMFDGPDTKSIVPVRAETTTAPQALFLLNNSLVIETSKQLAARLAADASLTNDEDRVRQLWLLMLSRPPETDEVKLALGFVAKHSWERFIQAVLGSNEFAYLD